MACSGAPGTLVGKPIDGQVIDADTGQPIAGAHVMYLWEAGVIPTTFSAHNAPTICYHAAAAITDTQGHFHIPAWEKAQTYGVPNREPTGRGYAKGYVSSVITPPEGPAKEPLAHTNDVIRMTRSHASGDERLEEISKITRRSCMHGGQSQRELVPLKRAAYEEAKLIASTTKELGQLERIKDNVAWDFVAPGPVGDDAELARRMRDFEEKMLK